MFNAEKIAKNILQGVEKAGKAPDQVIETLRKLLAQAKQLAASSPVKNEALDACIQKAQALLDSGDISMETVAKLSAELGELIKKASAGTSQQPANGGAQKPQTESGANAGSTPVSRTGTQAGAAPKPAAPSVQFSDVEAGAYYYDAVQWAVQQGIASGTTETTFSPDQDCTRAQTITLLWRASGSPAPKSQNNTFTDVKENAYYYHAVLWAAERGIVSGTAFKPDEAVTRAQLATFLYRNAGSPAIGSSGAFTDVPSDAYYSQAVAWVAAKGITSGTGEHTFSPDTVCTRGQIVTFLYRSKK